MAINKLSISKGSTKNTSKVSYDSPQSSARNINTTVNLDSRSKDTGFGSTGKKQIKTTGGM